MGTTTNTLSTSSQDLAILRDRLVEVDLGDACPRCQSVDVCPAWCVEVDEQRAADPALIFGRCLVEGCRERKVVIAKPYNNIVLCDVHPDRAMRYQFVNGAVSAKECDARCTMAKGPDCECACGGAQHGRHAVSG